MRNYEKRKYMSAFSLRKMRDPSRRAYLVHKKISSIEFFAFDFHYLWIR